jgi:hypothetical protein
MIKGTILLESLRPDAKLTGFRFVVTEVSRGRPSLSPQQVAAGIPSIWSAIEFQLEDDRAGELALALSEALSPGWYANFSSNTEVVVVYRSRVFRYPRGDTQRRTEAQAYGRSIGVPDHQLDWSE